MNLALMRSAGGRRRCGSGLAAAFLILGLAFAGLGLMPQIDGNLAVAANANPSGLPIPRFVSLRSNEVNLRTGPGLTYPIDWIYKRDGMPVEVIQEFDTWRKIRD